MGFWPSVKAWISLLFFSYLKVWNSHYTGESLLCLGGWKGVVVILSKRRRGKEKKTTGFACSGVVCALWWFPFRGLLWTCCYSLCISTHLRLSWPDYSKWKLNPNMETFALNEQHATSQYKYGWRVWTAKKLQSF